MVLSLVYKTRLQPLKQNTKAEGPKCATHGFCYWYRLEVSRYLPRIKKTQWGCCYLLFNSIKIRHQDYALKSAL